MAGLPVLGSAPRRWPPDVCPGAAGVVRPVHLRRRHRRRLLRRGGGGGDRLALPHEGLVLLLLLLPLVVHGGGVRERRVPRMLLRHRPRELLVVAAAVPAVAMVVGRAAAGAAAGARGLPLGRRPRDHPRDRLQLLQVGERLRVPTRVGRGRPGRPRPRGRRDRVVFRGRRGRGGLPGEVSLRLRREELRFDDGGNLQIMPRPPARSDLL